MKVFNYFGSKSLDKNNVSHLENLSPASPCLQAIHLSHHKAFPHNPLANKQEEDEWAGPAINYIKYD